MEKKTKDFVFSFVLIALGIYVVCEGYSIYRYAADAPYLITDFTVSPAFLPIVLGYALLFCSVLLLLQSLKTDLGFKGTLVHHFQDLKRWFLPAIKNPDTISMAIGLVIMGIYTFILLGRLPFWASSLAFMIALMAFLRADKWWKNIIVSVVAVGFVILLFQVAFKAALP
jgi:hypothetical protein